MSDGSHIAGVLKAARDQRELSVEDAAVQSGVPLRYVRLLEGETVTTGIADEFYLIPFFRKYAGFVGLEVDQLLPEFLSQVQQVPASRPASVAPGLGRPYVISIENLWRPAALVLAVLLATFLMMRNTPGHVAIAAAPESAGQTGNPPQRSMAHPAPETAPDTIKAPVAAAQTDGLTSDGSSVAAATALGMRQLRIVATETVWLKIERDDDPGEEFLFERGDTRTWTADDSFFLTVGNAGGLSLAFDGRELPPLGASGQVVRVRLPQPPVDTDDG